tara:strand:+ start:3722 stop:4945 length:1224 start_codon:yes stop_codon:yes gene_type:complete
MNIYIYILLIILIIYISIIFILYRKIIINKELFVSNYELNDVNDICEVRKKLGDKCINMKKGIKGDRGIIGYTGSKGQKGKKGCKGDDGKNGLDGIGIDNIMFVYESEATKTQLDYPNRFIVPIPKGKTGIQGKKGDDGKKGPKGINGIDGADVGCCLESLKGIDGPEGEPGPMGVKGYDGCALIHESFNKINNSSGNPLTISGGNLNIYAKINSTNNYVNFNKLIIEPKNYYDLNFKKICTDDNTCLNDLNKIYVLIFNYKETSNNEIKFIKDTMCDILLVGGGKNGTEIIEGNGGIVKYISNIVLEKGIYKVNVGKGLSAEDDKTLGISKITKENGSTYKDLLALSGADNEKIIATENNITGSFIEYGKKGFADGTNISEIGAGGEISKNGNNGIIIIKYKNNLK